MILIISCVLLAALLATTVIFMLAIIRCDSKKHLYFLPLIVCVWMFILGYLFEIHSRTDESAFVAHMFMYCGACFVAPLYLLFIADFLDVRIRRWQVAVIIGQAAANLIIAVTSPYQNLYFERYFMRSSPLFNTFDFMPGLLYMPFHLIQYACIAAAIVLLLRNVFRSNAFVKNQAILLLIGGSLPFAGNILFALRLSLMNGLNLTPVSMVIVIITFYIAITRYRLFDLVPMASKQALESMQEAFIVLDHRLYIMDANPAAREVFPNIDRRRMVCETSGWPDAMTRTLKTSQEPRSSVEFTIEGASIRHFKAAITRIANKGYPHGWLLLIYDITETVHLLNELERHAITDPLTGIHNRRYFMQHASLRLSECARLKKSAAVILFDLDRFKHVNDTYGHSAGDAVLRSAAELVSGKMRPYDLFARYGGEEFILFLPEIDQRTAIELAERIRATMENHVIHYESTVLTRTMSVGVYVSRDGSDALKTMIDAADAALYRAKESGRNRVEIG